MRNLVKALIYRRTTEETKRSILDETIKFLHERLDKALTRKVELSKYTVVPHKGKKRARKAPRKTYQQKLKQKYYGGAWDYQK